VKDTVHALDVVNFDRPNLDGRAEPMKITTEETILAGNLIDPDTGRLLAGRTAWETATATLLDVIAADPKVIEARSGDGDKVADQVTAQQGAGVA
jgi:hypothetical protein